MELRLCFLTGKMGLNYLVGNPGGSWAWTGREGKARQMDYFEGYCSNQRQGLDSDNGIALFGSLASWRHSTLFWRASTSKAPDAD
jgi:hypothetical protein